MLLLWLTPLCLYFRFGRKPVLFGAISVLSIFSSALAFAPSWPVFTVLFYLLGLGQITSYVVSFVLGRAFAFSYPPHYWLHILVFLLMYISTWKAIIILYL